MVNGDNSEYGCWLNNRANNYVRSDGLAVEYIGQYMDSADVDDVFYSISILPSYPDNIRRIFQPAVSKIANDTNMPADVREAAKAELIGFKRKIGSG